MLSIVQSRLGACVCVSTNIVAKGTTIARTGPARYVPHSNPDPHQKRLVRKGGQAQPSTWAGLGHVDVCCIGCSWACSGWLLFAVSLGNPSPPQHLPGERPLSPLKASIKSVMTGEGDHLPGEVRR